MSWPAVPTLAGRHVTLRPLLRSDREALLAAFGDGLEHSFATTVPGDATIDAWLDTIDSEQAAERARVFAVLDAEGRVSGTTRLMRMNARHRRVEIGGTVYARRVQRTGLNTEAKRLLLAYAFETLGVLCVQLRTDWLNRQSRAAIERLGAKMDGVMRGHMILGEHRRDTVVYSILEHEWPGVRRNIDALIARYQEPK
jgi:RimJ/RimL family protein N-acetyltransferase